MMPEELAVQVTSIKKGVFAFRAINHPLRQHMLQLMHQNQKMTVTELYTTLHLEQPVASQHLAILRRHGIVVAQRTGKHIFYSVNYARLEQLHKVAGALI
jgi:DNA-binding transcriptional ArsR family regulator